MSHYGKANDLFKSSVALLNKQTPKQQWAIDLCNGLSELNEGMKKTDEIVRAVAGIVDLIQRTQNVRGSV